MTTTHRYVFEVEVPDDTDLLDYTAVVGDAIDRATFKLSEDLWDQLSTNESWAIIVNGMEQYRFEEEPEYPEDAE